MTNTHQIIHINGHFVNQYILTYVNTLKMAYLLGLNRHKKFRRFIDMKKSKKVEQAEKNTEDCLSIEELIKLAEENNKLKLAKPLTDKNKEQDNTKEETN